MDPHRLIDRLQSANIADATAGDVAGLFAALQRLTGWAATVEGALARRAAELESTGCGLPATDVISRGTHTSRRQAQRTQRRGDTLANAPSLERQLAAGRISTEHADVLGSAAAQLGTDEQRAALFAEECELAERAASSTPAQFGRAVRRVIDRIAADDGIERSERQRSAASLTHGINDATGMGWIRAELHPDDYQRVVRRIDAEVAALRTSPEHERLRFDQLAARGFADLVCGGRARAVPPAEVIVLIDLDTLTNGLHARSIVEYSDGTPLPVETVRRHACTASVIPAVLDSDGMPLDVGRGARQATRAQRRALRTMYRTCAIGGCEHAFDRCEIHHVLEWIRHGGPTDLRNLVPICAFHHHRVHEGRWRLQLDPSTRELSVFLPSGELHSSSRPDLVAERAVA